MISVRLFKLKSGAIYGFSVKNHGSGAVCAAVSILTQNTVNSIEKFADGEFLFDYNKSGGFIRFEHIPLKNSEESRDAALLLKSMALGFEGIRDEYKNEINIKTEVKDD